ncbi:MAG: nitrous oxide-stimulated promoter family protein [Comamonadaceae bacterium]|nr:nitrous oxide-stimulated promoter family protein [Rubrivivax sp.]NLZ42181.1 nitrous oxide-stimulated promoter family protein [Comamonadaceae bacterium]
MDPACAPPGAAAQTDRCRAAALQAPRLVREWRTMAAMLHIWCDAQHGAAARGGRPLCEACEELLAYARQRLAHCPFGPAKPTCARCPVHCYGRRQRQAVREVMRCAGPRMLARHPWLAIAHLLDGRRALPPSPRARRAAQAAPRALPPACDAPAAPEQSPRPPAG